MEEVFDVWPRRLRPRHLLGSLFRDEPRAPPLPGPRLQARKKCHKKGAPPTLFYSRHPLGLRGCPPPRGLLLLAAHAREEYVSEVERASTLTGNRVDITAAVRARSRLFLRTHDRVSISCCVNMFPTLASRAPRCALAVWLRSWCLCADSHQALPVGGFRLRAFRPPVPQELLRGQGRQGRRRRVALTALLPATERGISPEL